MRVAYRERSEALIAALQADCAGPLAPQPCDTGMQLWASLRPRLSDVRLRDAAAEGGVEVAALADYFIGRPSQAGLVFGFGAVRPEAVRAGTRALAAAIERTGDL
jgi:GntR family transcriptional regulator/MocR family aminotransferase